MDNFSERTRAESSRKILIVTITLVALLVSAALIKNRGLEIDVKPNGVGVKLDPAAQPAPSIATQNDGSPIVTAPDAKVEVHVTGSSKSTPAQLPASGGMATNGAASPIVTGQGAVVKSTVDSRP
ncbi:hypothetical protein [Pseudomonas anguilliseptica]|uniref:hypothetical protein n=1 Tax=Pseudomonas anguilliseptica TaxID=53406 RepID=UPI00373659D2